MNTDATYLRPKSCSIAYLCLFLGGCHYVYLRRPGTQLIYWLTFGGLGVWWLYDFLRMPRLVEEWNKATFEPAPPIPWLNHCIATVSFLLVALIAYRARPDFFTMLAEQLKDSFTHHEPAKATALAAPQPAEPRAQSITPIAPMRPIAPAGRVLEISPISGQLVEHGSDVSYLSSIGGGGGSGPVFHPKPTPNPITPSLKGTALDRPTQR